MRTEILDLIKRYLEEGKLQGPVLNVGAAGTEYEKAQGYNMRGIFSDRGITEYNAVDIHKAEGIDYVVDFTKERLPGLPYRTILCTEMLEHCKDPYSLVRNCYRHLRDHGIIIVTVPDMYGVHCAQDYYRFTQNGLHMLCSQFENVESGDFGKEEKHDLEHYYVGRKIYVPTCNQTTSFGVVERNANEKREQKVPE
jgi:hypothetical protein